jgi:predicted DNA-binding transcriptional regulator AlpA
MSERLLTARELASRLGVSTGALLRWTRDGKVPGAVKLPSGAIRYRPELIEPWLDELAIGVADQRVTRADTADRGLSHTRTNRARRAGHYDALPFSASHTRPRDAAPTEEDDLDAC